MLGMGISTPFRSNRRTAPCAWTSGAPLNDLPPLKITQSGAPVAALIRRLLDLRPLHPRQFTVVAERRLATASNVLLVVAFVLIVVLACLAAVHAWHPVAPGTRLVALVVGTASSFFALLSIVVQSIGGVVSLIAYWRGHERVTVAECLHDFSLVQALAKEPVAVLEATAQWLTLRRQREEARLARLFGGGDKLAAVAIVAAGWSLAKEVMAQGPGPLQTVLIFAAAALGGMALGAMARQAQLARWGYPLGLVSLAITEAKRAVHAV